ncbi:MAG: NADH-quinone oxidoreductase subunit N [Nitrospiraceae bacterium]|nr:NADH-quinone oxidoreductase subunit N [Nitrospiraceae bacterium]
MSGADLLALLPLILISISPVAVMLAIAFFRGRGLAAALALLGLFISFVSLPFAASYAPRSVTPLLVIDNYALFYMGLVFAATFAVALLSDGYLRMLRVRSEEFYVLLLLAAAGSAVLVASAHFASFFLGLETLSVSLYALLSYPVTREKAIEAGVKYLVLAAISSAFLLFGMALVYALSGTMEFSGIAAWAAAGIKYSNPVFLGALALIAVGFGFKLAVAPFHMWTPDVYEGAPAPVSAFVATVSKGAVFALFLRYFARVDIHTMGSLALALTVISIASMFAGNLLALLQNNVKRILAYSSIAHLGYLIVAFLASGALRVTAVSFYLVAYFITMLGAFGVVTVLSGPDGDAEDIEGYRGLAARRPVIAGVFSLMLFSLAGIPLTAGFVGKFYIIAAGAGSALWLLISILVINSAIGIYYYVRVIITMYSPAPVEAEEAALPPKSTEPAGPAAPEQAASAAGAIIPIGGGLVLAVLAIGLIWLGVYPSPLLSLIRKTIQSLM